MQIFQDSKVKSPDKQGLGDQLEKIIYSRQGFLPYTPLIVAAFFLLIAAAVESMVPGNDMARYECYAMAFWHGGRTLQLLPFSQCDFMYQFIQYRSFPLEYPPFSLVFFSIPLLVPLLSYPLKFALVMGIAAAFIFWVLLKYGPRGSAAVFAAYLLIGAVATAFARFDLIPGGMTLVCLVLAERKRWTLAYIALALGVLTKLYPVTLFPLLFLAEQRDYQSFYFSQARLTIRTFPREFWRILQGMRGWRLKNVLIAAGVLALVTALFGSLNFKGAVLSSPAYLYLRPFHVESVGAVILWLASMVGVPVDWQISFGSLNIVSPISDIIAQGAVILLYLGYIYVLIMLWEGKMDLVQASIATLLVVIATGKVFSPQYLIWLIPLLAYSGASSGRWWIIWGATSLFTLAIYPGFYSLNITMLDLPRRAGFLQFIASRNELFIFLTVSYLVNFLNVRHRLPLAAAKSKVAIATPRNS